MEVIHGIQPDLLTASVVTLGMFDGVHRGHQALLRACRRHADQLGLPAVVLTYEPHPTKVLRPEAGIRLLTTFAEKMDLLAAAGMDDTVVVHFTPEFSLLTPLQFLRNVLVTALHPRVVVAGYRTTFGHSRAGTASVLRESGAKLGFAVEIVEPVEVSAGAVSSSRIRHSLELGEVELAAELLGYSYRLTGNVTHGDARGRQLGFPTANLSPHPDKIIPKDGVYVVDACVAGGTFRAVMNIGERPTFGAPRSLEAHLLDFSGDVYGQTLTVSFLARLRDNRAFPMPQALVEQIEDDIARARSLKNLPATPR